MSRLNFDIKYRPQIESGEYKVETKDGRQARIISWDKNGFECTEIVVLVTCATGTENCNIYTDKGLLRSNPYQENAKLFLITSEPELSEFEYAMLRYVQDAAHAADDDELVEITKKHSTELLDIAKKEALKGLPRWRHAFTICLEGNGKPTNQEYCYYSPKDKAFIVLPENSTEAKCLMLEDLKKLPRFKED